MSSNSSNSDSSAQQLQQAQGYTIQTFLASLIVSFVVFGAQVAAFLLIKQKLPRIYRPRTFLVPDKERVNAPPSGLWQWILPVFKTSNSDFIQKCGLDAYFFLRYLRMLLKIFIPMAFVIMPILIPINAVGGRNEDYVHEFPYDKNRTLWNDNSTVVGLNQLAWGNVRPTSTNRYWAHLVLAVGVILYCFYVFYQEMRGFIRLRQAYLTSPQHRIRASATTVLVSAIPRKWCTVEALEGLYDVFPGGIRNIWINRNFDELSDKVEERDDIALKLESAQTELIRKAKKKHMEEVKKQAKKSGKKQTKEEALADDKRRDEDAVKMAETGGESSGGPPNEADPTADVSQKRKSAVPIPVIGEKLEIVGDGIGKLGKTVFGGLKQAKDEVDGQLNSTQGFQLPPEEDLQELTQSQTDGVADGIGPGYSFVKASQRPPSSRKQSHSSSTKESEASQYHLAGSERAVTPPNDPEPSEAADSPILKYGSHDVDERVNRKSSVSVPVNNSTLRKGTTAPLMVIVQSNRGREHAMPSPVPQGHEKNGFPGMNEDPPWKALIAKFQFWKKSEEPEEPEVYPDAYVKEYDSVEDGEPLWKKYLSEKDRETMRLPVRGIKWLGWLPLVGQKVDTIDYCRKELARLNLEIETDQKEPQKFPLMNSAFIQFNHQVAAHLACQSISHHVPDIMAPRVVEISPGDVVWNNLSIQWWERYIRTFAAIAIVIGLVLTWTFPVAFTGLLANIKYLSSQYHWLSWLGRIPSQLISPIQGVLPQALLALLLFLLPIVLRTLARLQGHPTGMSVELAMSDFYFFFLFVQVFLVVTIASGATNVFAIAGQLGTNPQLIPNQLAETIPRASNYYFSYMLLQALSTSSGTLVQVGALVSWFIIAKLFDNTARQKWKRQITLPDMQWGAFFPIYTNLACIGLIYSVIAPFILIFNIITFGLFWFVFRYNTLYVTKFEFDTGGLLFPKSINHLFTGLYVMEICLIGLFFLVTGVDDNGQTSGAACIPQAAIMIAFLIITIGFQLYLNSTFGPLIRYLPITLEDDAVKRDEEFARAQDKKFNLVAEEHEGDDLNDLLEAREQREQDEEDNAEAIELRDIQRRRHHHGKTQSPAGNAPKVTTEASEAPTSWADRARRRPSAWAHHDAPAHDGNLRVDRLLKQHRLRRLARSDDAEQGAGGGKTGDADAQAKAIGDALFAGISDEIEDLSPEDRDFLVQRAFQHAAMRARRPVIWIPRDDLGVSDDEVRRTREFSENIWISNEYTGLDSKARVIYRKSPPDFSEVDLIEL